MLHNCQLPFPFPSFKTFSLYPPTIFSPWVHPDNPDIENTRQGGSSFGRQTPFAHRQLIFPRGRTLGGERTGRCCSSTSGDYRQAVAVLVFGRLEADQPEVSR